MISEKQIVEEYKKGMFIRQISRTHHASIVRVSKVLDKEGLRGGTPI
jgi:hypothetical protein